MKIKIANSGIRGKGIFAKKPIQKNETICFLKGELKTIPQIKKIYSSGKEKYGNPLQISPTKYLILNKPFVYFNHSCNPNSAIIKNKKMIALRKINLGKEITFDYSTTMAEVKSKLNNKLWGEEYSFWEIKCNCKSKNCRKLIRDFEYHPNKHKLLKNKILPNFIIKMYNDKTNWQRS